MKIYSSFYINVRYCQFNRNLRHFFYARDHVRYVRLMIDVKLHIFILLKE